MDGHLFYSHWFQVIIWGPTFPEALTGDKKSKATYRFNYVYAGVNRGAYRRDTRLGFPPKGGATGLSFTKNNNDFMKFNNAKKKDYSYYRSSKYSQDFLWRLTSDRIPNWND